MKTAIKSLLAACFGFGIVYLLGAFVQVGFDISTWSLDARFFVANCGALAAAIAVAISAGVTP